jgi:hypothetical protein
LGGHAERADRRAANVVSERDPADEATRGSSRDDRVGERCLVNHILRVEHELSD